MAKPRHFLDIASIPSGELRSILDEAKSRKAVRYASGNFPKGAPDQDSPLKDHVLAMVFEKSSTRTRISFDMAIRQLGGSSIVMSANDMQLGRGETIGDTAQVISRYVDACMLRVNRHQDLVEFADNASIPIINGLSETGHPCQTIATLQSFEETGLDLKNARLAWVGDGNNVAISLIEAVPKFGFQLVLACPPAYSPPKAVIEKAQSQQGRVELLRAPAKAVTGADAIITDCWVSMGDTDRAERFEALTPYQVDQVLMQKANPGALFSHCLPAHREEEVTAEVIDGEHSIIFDEAENRLHAQKAILTWCFGC